MLTSETSIEIQRPTRYLTQFCKHAAAMGETRGGHRPRNHATGGALARGELHIHAEYTETHGIVRISPWGRCTLQADGDTLTLRVDATDQDALRSIQDVVTRDLERFGRRDQVTVSWPPPRACDTDTEPAADGDTTLTPVPAARRSRRTTILLAALVVAVVGIHLGLGGAVLADSRWTSLSTNVVLAIVAGKILLATLGGRALRRRHLRPHAWARPHHHGLHNEESSDA